MGQAAYNPPSPPRARQPHYNANDYAQADPDRRSNQQLVWDLISNRGLNSDIALRHHLMPRVAVQDAGSLAEQDAVQLSSHVNVRKGTVELLRHDKSAASASSAAPPPPPPPAAAAAPPQHAALTVDGGAFDDALYSVCFTFDAEVPCVVSVYFYSREVTSHTGATVSLTSVLANGRYGTPRQYYFPPGVGQRFELDVHDALDVGALFDPAAVPGAAGREGADLLRHADGTLYFPAIISIFGVSDEEFKTAREDPAAMSLPNGGFILASSLSGSSLGVSPGPSSAGTDRKPLDGDSDLPGALTPSRGRTPSADSSPSSPNVSVRFQTTYLAFEERRAHDDGDDDAGQPAVTYKARVVRQKIHFDGASYEMQEIYGLRGNDSGDSASAAAAADPAEEMPECVVCLTAPRDTAVLPCRHMCLCADCAVILRSQTNRCPICRTFVENTLLINVQALQARPS